MEIKHVSISRFAALSDVEIPFKQGLNVLYGKNEAGKSTVIRAISSVLFLPIKTRNQKEKDTIKSFRPLSGGDEFGASLTFLQDGKAYSLKKTWCSEVRLEASDGSVYTDSEAVEQVEKLLPLGAKLYETLVFAKHEEFKETIKNVKTVGTQNIVSALRQSVMDAGGISIEAFREAVKEEYARLAGNWDMEAELPMNGRGIDNPYVKNNGEIIQWYYKRQRLGREIEQTKEEETHQAEIEKNITLLDEQYAVLEKELSLLEEDSAQMLRRAEIEKALASVNKARRRLEDIKTDWVELEKQIDKASTGIEAIVENLKQNEKELQRAKKQEEASRAKEIVEKIRAWDEEIEKLQVQCEDEITVRDIHALEKLEKVMSSAGGQYKGIRAKLQREQDVPVVVTADMNEPSVCASGKLSANEYLCFQIEGIARIEVQTSEEDYQVKRMRRREAEKEYHELCRQLEVKSLQQARQKREMQEGAKQKTQLLLTRRQDLLGSETLAALEETMQCGTASLIDTESLQVMKRQLETDLTRWEVKKEELLRKLSEYKKEFSVYPAVLSALYDVNEKARPLEEALNKISTDSPASAEEFLNRLNRLRQEASENRNERQALAQESREIESDASYEALTQLWEEYDSQFQRKIKRANTLMRIDSQVAELLDEMQQDTFIPLERTLNEYLALLTQGRYRTEGMDEGLEFSLLNENGRMPQHLLSSGTEDCVALAFRLALLSEVMGKEALCVLDDCLVDLDEVRRQKAAELIRHFAKKHQLIFATCSPEIAALLGGNKIEMESVK
jgi:exonuclease SbcC